jgi:hypothetical protein
MKHAKKLLILSSLLLVVACNKPQLPDPTVEYPTPPAALMEPSRNMQEIPTN